MGFTWSLYCAQRASSTSCRNSAGEAVVFRRAAEKQREKVGESVHHYVYVDNLGILSVDHDTVDKAICEVESHALILHLASVRTGSTKALGCELRGDLMASRTTPERYHRVRQAITAVLAHKRVSGRILEVVLGHGILAGLMCRPTLSTFNALYRFINVHYDRPAMLWDTVRDELGRCFRGLMMFLHADWTRQWNTYVSACDASEQGFGVVSAIWQPDEVAQVGRGKLGSHSARD